MKRMIIAATAVAGLTLAGCTQTQMGTATGAALGGIVVAALGGNVQQIAIGTLIGGAGGFVVSEYRQSQQPGVCIAVNQNGQQIYVTSGGQYTTTPTPYPLYVQC